MFLLKHLVHIALFSLLTVNAFSQDTLPNFSVKNRSGKVIVSWYNPFNDVALINIQRSSDSLKNFKTIHGVEDAAAITNGFLDAKAPDTRQFYRLFVQQSGGKYFFTAPIKPVLDTIKPKPKPAPAPKQSPQQKGQTPKQEPPKEQAPAAIPEATTPPPADPEGENKTFKPAGNTGQKIKFSNTKPVGTDNSKIEGGPSKQFTPPPVVVYANPAGHVVIVLPEEKKNIYTLKFFSDNGTPLFTLNKLRDSYLTIEKTNFHNAGWVRCELYEQDKLRERYRVFIPKD